MVKSIGMNELRTEKFRSLPARVVSNCTEALDINVPESKDMDSSSGSLFSFYRPRSRDSSGIHIIAGAESREGMLSFLLRFIFHCSTLFSTIRLPGDNGPRPSYSDSGIMATLA